MSKDRTAATAANRAREARRRVAAASTPQERLRAAFDWFRAAQPPDRTVDAVARELARLAGRADDRAARHLSDEAGERPGP